MAEIAVGIDSREERYVARWRDPKKLKSNLVAVKTVRDAGYLGLVVLGIMVIAMIAVLMFWLAQWCLGLMRTIDSDALLVLSFVVTMGSISVTAMSHVRQLIAALKYIGQLEERVEALEKSSTSAS